MELRTIDKIAKSFETKNSFLESSIEYFFVIFPLVVIGLVYYNLFRKWVKE